MTIPSRNLNYPTAIKFGAGRIKELAEHCRAVGMARPLLVTDPGLAALPMAADVVNHLRRAGLGVAVFIDVRANPVEANVTDGVKAFRAGDHDGVVAFGGGSALDVGKIVALMHGQTLSVFDLEDVDDWWTRADASKIAPVVAVPTTAGTGSEVGRAGVITHPKTHEKKIIFHPAILPKIAILDPELTVGLPPTLTAATGMDALAHCVEAYCAPFYHPLAAGVALEGMRLIKENLARAVKKGSDVTARGHMLMASTMGATAFQRGLGAVHALSHPLGGVYDAHHGTLNGVLLPYVLKANKRKVEKEIERAAAYLDIKGGFGGFLKWLLALRKDIGIPHTLADLRIDTTRLDDIAAMAVKDPSAGGNPIPFTEKQYKALAKRAIVGDL
jgi:alcohol dehydrogenase